MSDIDQVLFVENNIRGGVSFINQRHCSTDENNSSEATTNFDMMYIDGKW